jgi:glycosyltransferase involved in cell wall biosynthesis
VAGLQHRRKKRILCFTSYYLPGFKSGGPLRSLLHLQEWFGDNYEFAVITRNRDLGESSCYEGLGDGVWQTVGGIQVCYLSPPYWQPTPILAAVREFQPDALYFHSSVDFSLTIVPLVLRRLGQLPRQLPVVVAPRGEYSPGALSIKPIRKKIYFLFAKLIGLHDRVIWQATKDEEAAQIRFRWGPKTRILLAPNLPSRLSSAIKSPEARAKAEGSLRLVFLSRIARMKNLHGALEILGGVKVPVILDIYGTTEDPAYWEECRILISKLPVNIQAAYLGPVSPDEVIPTLSRYDALMLPTLGENFGHVIHEALLAGCPVLISDRTPWRGLAEKQAGFDLPLEQPERFREAIEQLAAMTESEHATWSARARAYGERYAMNTEIVEQSRRLLEAGTS